MPYIFEKKKYLLVKCLALVGLVILLIAVRNGLFSWGWPEVLNVAVVQSRKTLLGLRKLFFLHVFFFTTFMWLFGYFYVFSWTKFPTYSLDWAKKPFLECLRLTFKSKFNFHKRYFFGLNKLYCYVMHWEESLFWHQSYSIDKKLI